ncbi:MAG: UbiA family prenyltransferase [Bacteroidia bacterium]
MKQVYTLFQALSLDVVAGTVICSAAIGRYYQIEMPIQALVCLAIAVWLIYTIDHLLDAEKIIGKPASFRHQVHKLYKKQLVVVAVLVGLMGAVVAFYLPLIILINGLFGVLFTLVYFLLLKKKWFWQKEICVAIGFTWGIVLAPLCLHQGYLSWVQVLIIPQVLMLAFANLLIFSWFEIVNDQQDGHPSMAIHLGIKRSEGLIQFIILCGIVVCILTMLSPLLWRGAGGEAQATLLMQGILLLMFVLLLFIFKRANYFRQNDLYRVIGDGIFCIPVLFMLYVHPY